MEKPKVIITGANGQLGCEFRALEQAFSDFEFVFASKLDLDVTVESWVKQFITDHKPAAVVNCAAYTNVERAEDETENAHLGNALAAGFIADACHETGSMMIHISTDYVFDGTSNKPYTESDSVNPINEYGKSKLEGERLVDEKIERHFTLRTSWVYGNFGHNFYKTMIRLAKERGSLSVVDDQFASPTYAGLLAADILRLLQKVIIKHEHIEYGLYHYTQTGIASWFNFAQEIVLQSKLNVPVNAVKTGAFPTKAIRPVYSKLDTTKWEKQIGIPLYDWRDGLAMCLNNLPSPIR